MPDAALDPAKLDSQAASCGTNSARTGTPFFGYIIAEAPVNTDFVNFFHNQIFTTWPVFLNATISARRAIHRTAIPASPLQRHGAGCFLILMTKRLRALLLTAHAE